MFSAASTSLEVVFIQDAQFSWSQSGLVFCEAQRLISHGVLHHVPYRAAVAVLMQQNKQAN
jgi:hypothetical protein